MITLYILSISMVYFFIYWYVCQPCTKPINYFQDSPRFVRIELLLYGQASFSNVTIQIRGIRQQKVMYELPIEAEPLSHSRMHYLLSHWFSSLHFYAVTCSTCLMSEVSVCSVAFRTTERDCDEALDSHRWVTLVLISASRALIRSIWDDMSPRVSSMYGYSFSTCVKKYLGKFYGSFDMYGVWAPSWSSLGHNQSVEEAESVRGMDTEMTNTWPVRFTIQGFALH